MVETEKIKYVYLLGIGGIGLSALARYFSFAGNSFRVRQTLLL